MDLSLLSAQTPSLNNDGSSLIEVQLLYYRHIQFGVRRRCLPGHDFHYNRHRTAVDDCMAPRHLQLWHSECLATRYVPLRCPVLYW